MKNISFAIINILLLSLLTTTVEAAIPLKCPSTDTIKSIQFGTVGIDSRNKTYFASQVDKYDTAEYWGFMITGIKAVSYDDALTKAKNSLAMLAFNYGPIQDQGHKWKCYYITRSEHEAYAITYP